MVGFVGTVEGILNTFNLGREYKGYIYSISLIDTFQAPGFSDMLLKVEVCSSDDDNYLILETAIDSEMDRLSRKLQERFPKMTVRYDVVSKQDMLPFEVSKGEYVVAFSVEEDV